MFVIAATSCDSNIFDFDVNLSSVTLSADFGSTSQTIPAIPCDPATPAACAIDISVAQTQVATVSVAPSCEAGSCFADASATLSQEVAVLQDDAFVTQVERRATSLVQSVDLAYTMPVNTLNFDLPGVAVYVGPTGAKTPADPGVVLVDMVPIIQAGMPFTEPRHVTIAEGTPASNLVEGAIRSKTPFAFVVVVATPHLGPGDPVPAGAFQIDIVPTVSVGFP